METNRQPRSAQSWLALNRQFQSALGELRGRYRSWQALKDQALCTISATLPGDSDKLRRILADEKRRIFEELKSACERAENEYREKLLSVRRLHHKLLLL